VEIETCKTFQVSDPDIWDPTADIFQISAIERGRVCMSESYDVCPHDVCSHDLCLHDFRFVFA